MLSPTAQKIQDTLKQLGFSNPVQELPQTTRSASEAAQALGCKMGQIAKSLVFQGKNSRNPLLVIASGPNRVDEQKLSERISEPIERADPAFVKEKSGYAIGGVPPIGHSEPIPIYIDEDLLKYEEIWAAAGTPNAVFRLTPAELVQMTKGKVVAIKP